MPAREYGMVSFDAIKRNVNIVHRNSFIDVVHFSDVRGMSHLFLCDGTEGFENELFYVKDFFIGNGKSTMASIAKQDPALNMMNSNVSVKLEAVNMNWKLCA